MLSRDATVTEVHVKHAVQGSELGPTVEMSGAPRQFAI